MWAALILGACAAWVVLPAPAHACTCARIAPSAAVDNAGVVFTGTVRLSGRTEEGDEDTNDVVWVMDVEEVFKGEVTETAGVTTGDWCGASGHAGHRYLVLGTPTEVAGVFRTDLCTITSLEEDGSYADRVLAAAGAGRAPPPGTGPSDDWVSDHDGTQPIVTANDLLVVGIAIVVCGGIYALVRYRRRVNPLKL